MLEEHKDVIEKCLINKREVTVDNKAKMMTKGPCNKVTDGKCKAYLYPESKWKIGDCPLASHIILVEDEHKFKNPLKESKRASG